MTKLFTLLLIAAPLFSVAQKKNDSLVTSIGWVLHQGDTITLGIGSMPDGRYKFVQTSESGTLVGDGHLSNRYSGKTFEIFKIKVFRGRQVPVIKYGNPKNKIMGQRWDIEIEGAITSGEINVPEQYRKEKPHTPAISRADELTKLKKLLDDGVLTKEEFEAEKKKILDAK